MLSLLATTTELFAPLSRTVVPFQYAWRFHYGDDPSSPPECGPGTCAFTEDLSGFALCANVERNPNRFSEKDCRIACCYDPDCMVWQAFPLEYGRQCYHGYKNQNVTCNHTASSSKMGGGRRSVSPSPAFRTDYSFAVADASSKLDAAWDVVDAPHDFISEFGNFTDNDANFKQGYLPRNASWYRKHFALPTDWNTDGGSTHVHFEGVFHHATIFLNGKYLMSHECGYTGFTVRLDNATGVIRFGAGSANANVLTVRADASFGSGHWYEGGGIYRPVHLVHTPATHIVHDGFFVRPVLQNRERGVDDDVIVSVEIETFAAAASTNSVAHTLEFVVKDQATGAEVAYLSHPLAQGQIPTLGGPSIVINATVHMATTAKIWSVQEPNLYDVTVTLTVGSVSADVMSVTTGFRTATWGVDPAFQLNGKPFHLRGFAHHNSIGGLGVAIPERVELFRIQASRALGSNIWRMSHNPYTPWVYDLLDATGVMCWDENRDYGAKYGSGAYAVAMHDMVKRDRNHASIVIWSFCNEYECEQEDPEYSGKAFRSAAYGVDFGVRPVSANDKGYGAPDSIDVQGMSHAKTPDFVAFHKANPTKPSVLSECCSCSTERAVDRSTDTCIATQNDPGILPYVTGSLGVWTLMDYFGEPHGTGTSAWPYVSCDFGQFDIAGFPKPHAYWYTANWLQRFNASYLPNGRPPLPEKTVARILSTPYSVQYHTSNTINVMTSAPAGELFVDGKSVGTASATTLDDGTFLEMVFDLDQHVKAIQDSCTGKSSFNISANGVQCHGLVSGAPATTAETCAEACCAMLGCNTWQILAEVGKNPTCWIGFAQEPVGKCAKPKKEKRPWIGGQRVVPPPTPVKAINNATFVALSVTGKTLATHTIMAPSSNTGAPKGSDEMRILLTLDVPSATTGTGNSLVLDGRDVAMVRASLVGKDDGDSALFAVANNRLTWRVVSGPGVVAGTANGDPASHEWMKSHSIDAYGGLARGMFRVSVDCTSMNHEVTPSIDLDAARSPTKIGSSASECKSLAVPIVVEARFADGSGTPMTISIPTSVDLEKDGVMAVAKAGVTSDMTYLETFVG